MEDCSEGGATGRGYGGTMTFQANGMVGIDKEKKKYKKRLRLFTMILMRMMMQ